MSLKGIIGDDDDVIRKLGIAPFQQALLSACPPPYHLRTESNSVAETLYFCAFWKHIQWAGTEAKL
jgi:hypothetical protein